MHEEPTILDDERRCPTCNAVIPPDAPEGLCPSCLAGRGMLSARVSVGGSGGMFTPPTPEELDRIIVAYEVLELIGAGGMGAVYKARQPHLDRLVALKLLPIESSESDPEFGERFKREAQAMARLSHPNIVTVHDFGESTEGHFYLVMEFIEGTNLHDLIRSGNLTPAEALAIVPQICDGLQFAHSQGIIHRDIKPANILLDKSGNVKLTDFGLAKILGTDHTALYTLTLEGRAMGTPNYMAPEQSSGSSAIDHRADIYSLGVVFYELLTGQVPKGVFDPPSQKVEVDVRLDEVVLRSMQSEPEKRYQQVSEVKTDVQEITRTLPAEPLPVPPARPVAAAPSQKSSKLGYLIWFLLVSGILFVPIFLISGYFLAYNAKPSRPDDPPMPLTTVPPPAPAREAAEMTREAATTFDGQILDVERLTAQLRALNPQDPGLSLETGLAERDGKLFLRAQVRGSDQLDAIHSARDLSPLSAYPWSELILEALAIEDLAFCRGMQLRILQARDLPLLKSLEGLENSSLEEAYLDRCGKFGFSLSPLARASLKVLHIHQMDGVEFSLEPLRSTSLEDLLLGGLSVPSLEPLSGLPLQTLNCHGVEGLRDFSPLASSPLINLYLYFPPEDTDWNFLKTLKVERLHLGGPHAKPALPLLHHLDLKFLELRSLGPTSAAEISCNSLEHLAVSETKEFSLSGIGTLSALTTFTLQDVPEVDLLPLVQAKFNQTLELVGQVPPMQGFLQVPITSLSIPAPGPEDLGELKAHPTLQQIRLWPPLDAALPKEEFWRRYDAGEFTEQK